MRDYASPEQLLILSNMESYNAELIQHKKSQSERIVLLNSMAKWQMESLISSGKTKLLSTIKND